MTACNERPPEGHPFHGSLVACHLAGDHLIFGEPHSWDIDAARARADVLWAAMEKLRARFPDREVEQFDAQLPHPLAVYSVGWACEDCAFRTDNETMALAHSDERKHSLAQMRSPDPYRRWELSAGPWLVVRFADPELAQRRADAPAQIDNASLPAGAPMTYYCVSCGYQVAVLSEDWWRTPPPAVCLWCQGRESSEYAIWKPTGAVFRVGPDGAVDENPIIEAEA